jgi:hypothetical protein
MQSASGENHRTLLTLKERPKMAFDIALPIKVVITSAQ